MIEISIDTNTGKLQEIFAKYPAEAKRMAQEEFSRWAMGTANKAKKRAPYRTGNLARSIMGMKTESGAAASANTEYAKYVEPPPLGVPMKRRMTRTQYLYNSAMEELDALVLRINERIGDYFDRK